MRKFFIMRLKKLDRFMNKVYFSKSGSKAWSFYLWSLFDNFNVSRYCVVFEVDKAMKSCINDKDTDELSRSKYSWWRHVNSTFVVTSRELYVTDNVFSDLKKGSIVAQFSDANLNGQEMVENFSSQSNVNNFFSLREHFTIFFLLRGGDDFNCT